jgi:cytochrome c biogenesis protein CcmG/thiol:disulfide interchange protein DsbE
VSFSHRSRNTVVAILLALLVAGGAYSVLRHRSEEREQHIRALANRTPAPDFSLTDLQGKPLQLTTFHGKVVLLDYWATWCAPCKIEVPHLVELQKKYGPQGLQIIGISMDDDSATVKTFAHEFVVNYPIALGSAQLAQAYGGVLGLPVAFLVDRDGRIVKRMDGDAELEGLDREIGQLLKEN